jgi:hypothetical protein
MQHRRHVGFGPPSKTCLRSALQRLHETAVRSMPKGHFDTSRKPLDHLGVAKLFAKARHRDRRTSIVLAPYLSGFVRKEFMDLLTTVPLLIIDDLGMRKLPLTAAEELLEIIMRRYERASTLLTSNRPVDDWGKLLGDSAAVTAMLDRLLHHGHVLKCGPRSWPTKTSSSGDAL